jgi:hypothetical protein
MAFSTQSVQDGMEFGQNAYFVRRGMAKFTTTGTTVTIKTGMKKVIAFSLNYVSAVASTDGPLSLNNAAGNGPTDDGTLTVDTNGTLTVTRPAGTTSGAIFSYQLIGY